MRTKTVSERDAESALPPKKPLAPNIERDGRILTSQLYFPNQRLNEQDSLFDRRLVMRVSSSDEGRFGRFDFVV